MYFYSEVDCEIRITEVAYICLSPELDCLFELKYLDSNDLSYP
jgi:hypothetical protein